MRRRDVLGLAGAALAAPRLGHAQADQVLRFVPQADLAILDPIITSTYVTRDHGFMVFDTLYGIDEDYVPHPQMVEGHAVEQDGLLWRMTLREGLLFHDGTPVLARDAVASLQRWLKRDAFASDIVPILDEMSAPSDREIRIRLKRPFPLLPAVLGKANSNMPCIMPERLALTDATRQVTEMVGSGPFRYVPAERMSGALNVYEKFDRYVPRPSGTPSFLAGPKIVHVNRVEWRTIPDPATAFAALQAGEVDWWAQPIPDILPRLKSNRNIRTEVLDPAGYLALMRFNHLHAPFKDNPALRRAILLAVSQSDCMTAAAGEDPSLWRAPVGYFTPGPMVSDVGMAAMQGPRDLAKAREAVQASGYKGERIVLMAPTDYHSINAMTEVVADVLRRIGLNIDYQAMDWGTMVRRWTSVQPIENGGWSLYCTTTTAVSSVDPADHRSIRGNGLQGAQGWWTNAPMEALRNEFLATADTAAQKRICADMQELAFQEAPYVPLGVFFQPTAWRRNVTGQLPGFNRFYNVRKS
jgi:peptide/nickel transport system substrate-binding protein